MTYYRSSANLMTLVPWLRFSSDSGTCFSHFEQLMFVVARCYRHFAVLRAYLNPTNLQTPAGLCLLIEL